MLTSVPTTQDVTKRQQLRTWQKLLRMDWFLTLLIFTLTCISVVIIYSATYANEKEMYRITYKQQMGWIVIGFAAYFFMALVDYRRWLKYAYWAFGLTILTLIAVLLFGRVDHGARSWLKIGPIGFQPSELCKLAFILFLARYFMHNQNRGFRTFCTVLFFVLIPSALIFKQPALGSAAVFLPTAYCMMFIAGVRNRYLLTPMVIGIALVGYVLWCLSPSDPTTVHHVFFLKQFQEDRIMTFLHPDLDPQNAGWNITQSLNAVGSGGWDGKGFLQGDIVNRGFLPGTIAHNDFIYPVLCEQFGFIGGGTLILLMGILLLMIIRVAFVTTDPVGTYIASGIGGMLLTHIFVNIGMTIKVVPITGIPLPFISYGGTFLVVCLASMGLVQSIWIHRRNE